MADRQADPDGWHGGNTYEDFMGRWSRMLGREFVQWLAPDPGLNWLDVGCGTGALVDAILASAEPASVIGCDPAQPLVDYAGRHTQDERASFVLAGAGSLPSHPQGYDVVSSLLALNFMPDPVAALAEMRSLLRPGGCVAACVWDYAGQMQFLRHFWDVAVECDPECAKLDEGVRFPICQPQPLAQAFREGGLHEVAFEALEIPTHFASFADYWDPMLAGTGPASAYVASLDEAARMRFRSRLQERVDPSGRGPIELIARAWVARGSNA